MKNKGLLITSAILLILAMAVMAGPRKSKPVLNRELPVITLTSSQVGQHVNSKEAAVPNIKPGNASRVVYVNDSTREQTDYCLLYLHGFSASPEEGNPSHVNLGKAFGMNTYADFLTKIVGLTPVNSK